MIDREAIQRFLGREVVITLNNDKNLVGEFREIFNTSLLLFNPNFRENVISLEDITQIRLREKNRGENNEE